MTDHYLIINNKLRVTPNHLLFINGELIPAGEVKEGDHFVMGSDSEVTVMAVQQVFSQVPTYNFELETSTQLYFADNIPVYPPKLGANGQITQNSHQMGLF